MADSIGKSQTTFYIFRHGETFATKANTGYGRKVFTADILEEGKPILRKLGEYLKNVPTDFNTSSKIRRCIQTVGIISQESDKKFVFDSRLNEYFLEPFGRFRRRLKGVLLDIDKNDYQSVCICTHGACIAALVEILTGTKYASPKYLNYPDPGVLLVIEDGVIKDQVDFN